MKRAQKYAKKTFLAMDNRYKSVKRVFPNSIDLIEETSGYYMGVKEVKTISSEFITSLESLGFIHHTTDKASHSGRGIDLDLINPITGRYMTGSSSGTALNVFLGINDIGVGTDGGGSVLAPAISLNLIGFIHPELGKSKKIDEEVKISTDGIVFTPSVGLISRSLYPIREIATELFKANYEKINKHYSIGIDEDATLLFKTLKDIGYMPTKIKMSDKYISSRKKLITELTELLDTYDVVISKEGPVDLNGFGDSIFGHFTAETKEYQNLSNKGFLRVANMVHAIALSVPTKDLSVGFVLITKNEGENLTKLLSLAEQLLGEPDELVTRYFCEHTKYFEMGI